MARFPPPDDLTDEEVRELKRLAADSPAVRKMLTEWENHRAVKAFFKKTWWVVGGTIATVLSGKEIIHAVTQWLLKH